MVGRLWHDIPGGQSAAGRYLGRGPTPNATARVGRLMLHRGNWEGTRHWNCHADHRLSGQADMRYNTPMRIISLQSGSNGNCVYVETNGVKLLFDAGISGILVQDRLAIHDRVAAGIDGVLISHDHIDHSRSMGILHRKFGLPIYATAKTYGAAKRYAVGEIEDLRHFVAGENVHFGKVTVETIPTPHDGVDGVVFVVDDGEHRLGIMTDLGHVFDGLADEYGSLQEFYRLLPGCHPPKA